jgi:hypothetical protein
MHRFLEQEDLVSRVLVSYIHMHALAKIFIRNRRETGELERLERGIVQILLVKLLDTSNGSDNRG